MIKARYPCFITRGITRGSQNRTDFIYGPQTTLCVDPKKGEKVYKILNNSKQSAKFSKLINKNRDINWVDLESYCTQITTVRPDPTESFNECIGHLVHWTTTAGELILGLETLSRVRRSLSGHSLLCSSQSFLTLTHDFKISMMLQMLTNS